MATSTNSIYTLSDGFKVYTRTWTPTQPPKAHILFMHGFSDRVDHYDAFFTVLTTTYPIQVFGWDRRGWGKSVHAKSDRGDTGPMEQQINETNNFIHNIISMIPDLKSTPLFMMGHSMGGQETAYYMLNTTPINNDARTHLAGFILESPYIGLDAATQPSAIKIAVGRFASRLLPHFQIPNPIELAYLSPDKAVQKMYGDDPLCHNLGTLECFRDMLERQAQLTALAKKTQPAPAHLTAKLSHPVLWTHGTADKATDYPVSKLLCERLEACDQVKDSKVFKGYEGWFHQLHNEPNGCREQYARDVADWVLGVVERKKGKLESHL